MYTNLIVDLNNLAFTIRHATVKTPASIRQKEENVDKFLFKEILMSIINFSYTNNVDSIVIACDSKNVWRKDIYPEYKASSTTDEDIYYEEVLQSTEIIKKFFRECTKSYVLEVPRTEADDIIAVWAQESIGVNNIILSSDRDFIQLIDDRTSLYSIAQKTWRTSTDPKFDLFEKCIRGDRNDNIRSAYPRIKKTKLEEAWKDSMVMLNILETHLKDGSVVKDLYEFNSSLIDLNKQPEDIRKSIIEAINTCETGTFSELKNVKFFSDHSLKEFSNILDYKGRILKCEPIFFTK